MSVLATGLHDPRGMAIGPDGRLYVAEAGTTEGQFDPPPPPPPSEPPTRTRCEVYWPVGPATAGATSRISRIDLRSGQVRTVADQLPSMGSNTLFGGPDGDFYVTQCGYHCNDRSALPASLPSRRPGQVLRVRVPGSSAHCDEED